MMPDSSIEIMGRIDHQVKYRGVRIETEGVSSILQSAGKITTKSELSALTFITSHPQVGGELLVSFVAPAASKDVGIEERRNGLPRVVPSTSPFSPDGSGTTAELIRALKKAVEEQLPSYMRPAYILPVEYLPLTLNGKTDRRKLERVFQGLGLGELMKVQGGK